MKRRNYRFGPDKVDHQQKDNKNKNTAPAEPWRDPGPNGLRPFCEKIGFTPDPKQLTVLESATGRNNNRIVLNCSRQWGKSLVLAARAVRLMTVIQPGAVVLVVSKTLAQTGETIRKMDRFFHALDIPTRRSGDGKTMTRVLIPNEFQGSRVIGLAADDDKVRSYSAHMVILDEAARVPDDVWLAIEPTLATTSGELIAASTPEGKRGMFWEVWANGGPAWLRIHATVEECPRVSRDFIENQRRIHGEKFFRKEYLCEFIETGTYLLSRDQVEKLLTDKERPLR